MEWKTFDIKETGLLIIPTYQSHYRYYRWPSEWAIIPRIDPIEISHMMRYGMLTIKRAWPSNHPQDFPSPSFRSVFDPLNRSSKILSTHILWSISWVCSYPFDMSCFGPHSKFSRFPRGLAEASSWPSPQMAFLPNMRPLSKTTCSVEYWVTHDMLLGCCFGLLLGLIFWGSWWDFEALRLENWEHENSHAIYAESVALWKFQMFQVWRAQAPDPQFQIHSFKLYLSRECISLE